MREAYNQWKYSKYDGLKSTNHKVISVEETRLFTVVRVALSGPTNPDDLKAYFKKRVTEVKRLLLKDMDEKKRVLTMLRAMRKQERARKLIESATSLRLKQIKKS